MSTTTNNNNNSNSSSSTTTASSLSKKYPIPSELVPNFTPKEVSDLQHTFAKFDVNHNTTMDKNELKAALQAMGEYVSDDNVLELLRESNLDNDNTTLTFLEFISVVLRLRMGKKVPMVRHPSGKGLVRAPSGHYNVVTSDSGAKHSYSDAEKVAFTEHINRVLKDDERLRDRLPLDSQSDALFTAVSDGILLCKLINKAVPDTVDERALNMKDKLNVYHINENQNLVINAAKAIGCKVVNIHNDDLIEGTVHIVLGLVWQIVRIQLLSQINLKNHPELVRLLEEGEDLSMLLKLPADQLLLRWLNFHLKAAGDSRRVRNFGDDLKDSHVYTVVLNQIDSKVCDLNALKENDATKRAEMVITNAHSLGVESFIRPENIVQANQKLNLAFCAQIFNTNPGLKVTEEELVDMAGLLNDDVGDTREERAFRMWINSLGIEDLYVNHLFEDLRDGVVFLQVMDRIEPGTVSWAKVNRPPKNKFKRVENTNYVIVLGKSNAFKFSLVGIGGVDIVDGNKKLILSVVWQLMRQHCLKVLSSLTSNGQLATDRQILDWANDRVQRTGKETRMSSFRDSTLSTSIFFFHLCSALAPGIVDPSIATAGETPEEKESNAKYVISIARKLGATVFLTWEDIVEVKSKMILTFVASLMAWDQSAPGRAL
jgi:plastin-1